MPPKRRNSRNRNGRKGSRGRPRHKRIKKSLMAKCPPPVEEGFLFEDMKPVVIARPDHCISRKNIDREALKVLYRLKDHGYLAYLVGGSVRDLLLGKTPKDFDIGTNARPEEIKRLFHYSRIIGKRFRLVHVYFKGGKIIEVSTFRRQSDYADREALREGMESEDIYGSPREDAFRRDLTINGLFYNIADFSIIDYVGGMEDLKAGIIRTIGEPERRFLRDPVRMMRAVRHAARTGFQIEPATWKAIVMHADKIRLCAVPRVRDEWLKDLRSGASALWAGYMIDSGLMAAVFPAMGRLMEKVGAGRFRQLMTAMLRELDELVKRGQELSDAFYLAVFALAVLHDLPQWKALSSQRVRWPTYEVRFLLDDMLEPYDFKKADRDLVSQLLSSQWPIEYCKSTGRWQKRVWSKATFPEALMLHNCLMRALGEPEVKVPAPGTGKRPAKRRRRRGRKRGRGAKKAAVQEDGTT